MTEDDYARKIRNYVGDDIYTHLATQALNIAPDDVTVEQRRAAKRVVLATLFGTAAPKTEQPSSGSVKAWLFDCWFTEVDGVYRKDDSDVTITLREADDIVTREQAVDELDRAIYTLNGLRDTLSKEPEDQQETRIPYNEFRHVDAMNYVDAYRDSADMADDQITDRLTSLAAYIESIDRIPTTLLAEYRAYQTAQQLRAHPVAVANIIVKLDTRG
jgi:hypothetical protein